MKKTTLQFSGGPLEGAVTLVFSYHQDTATLHRRYTDGMANLFLMRGATECCIYSNGTMVGTGMAWCYRKDKFNRKKGERISLARAMRDYICHLTKEQRRYIWQNYLAARPINTDHRNTQSRKKALKSVLDTLLGGMNTTNNATTA